MSEDWRNYIDEKRLAAKAKSDAEFERKVQEYLRTRRPSREEKRKMERERLQEARRTFVHKFFCEINGCTVRSSGPYQVVDGNIIQSAASPPSYYVEVECVSRQDSEWTITTYWNKPENLECCFNCHRWACKSHYAQYGQGRVICQNCAEALRQSGQLPKKRNKFLDWFRNPG